MKLKDFIQEANEDLSKPPEGSYNKKQWAELMGVKNTTIGDVHKYLKQAVKDGKLTCEGSYSVDGVIDLYYKLIE